MNFDSLAVVIVMNSERCHLPLDIVERIYQCARDVTTNNFTLGKVSVINNNRNVLRHEIEHNLQHYEVVLLVGSFQEAATTIFDTLSSIYEKQLVELKDTYQHRIGGLESNQNYNLQLPYNFKQLAVDNNILCMKQVYIINIDSENYLASVDAFLKIAFRTMRPFIKELYLTESVANGEVNLSSCNCSEGEIEVSEKRILITANTLKNVNKIELDLNSKFGKLIYKRDFIDDYMKNIIQSDEEHIQEAISVISQCLTEYHPENIFLCFNGGKDCTVLLHLLLCVLRYKFPSYTDPIVCLYIEHRNPFPEITSFVHDMAQYYNLEIVTERLGIKDSLGNMLQQFGGRMKGCLMGTRRTDPFSEHLEHFHKTDPGWPAIMRVAPVLNWYYSQIWQYLRNNQVPYCCLYDQGYTSLGNIVNTVPNAALQYRNVVKNEVTYMPAYKLLDGSLERSGRVTNVR